RAVKDGALRADDAIQRLERSQHWVWTAMAPESKWLLAIAVGPLTLTMAQGIVHQVVRVLAPDCLPLFLTDGFKEYVTALLRHFGYWVLPERQRAQGPAPKPRWMPLPKLLYAQVVKSYRRRRLVGVKHRVVFGTMDTGSRQCCRPAVGRSIRPLSRGSIWTCASGWLLSAVGSTRFARERTAWYSSWCCFKATTTFACPMPPCVCLWLHRSPPMARARPHRGDLARRRWPLGCPSGAGRCVRCTCSVCRRGRSRKRCSGRG